MKKIVTIIALAFAAVNLTISIINGELSTPSIVLPILLVAVMGLKKVTRRVN